jgi:alkylhydroperoxidase family enzyme
MEGARGMVRSRWKEDQGMAYLDFQETIGGQPASMPPVPVAPLHDLAVADAAPARLSALEWSVVALAERDGLSTLRTPGRIATAVTLLFGDRPNPQLADPRLEALRRIAVLSWHHGYTVPSAEVRAFIAAGFTPDQYELVVDSISRGRARATMRRSRR